MTKANSIDIDQLAEMARIALTDDERRLFSDQLGEVLGYIGRLDEVDVSGVEPMVHAFPLKNVWEADEVGEVLPVEVALKNAPASRENMVVVPKVVE